MRLEVTADVVGREEVPHVIGSVKHQRLQEIHIADAFPFDYILKQNGGKDIAQVFKNDLLLLWQMRQIGQTSKGEIIAKRLCGSFNTMEGEVLRIGEAMDMF